MIQAYDWALCRTFLAVIRAGSFSGAARDLGQTPPTVRRQVEQLEATIGALLFRRLQDGVRPTPIAERLAPHAERVESAATAFARASRDERLSGVVRIVADDVIATRMLPGILASLRGSHDDLRFEVAVEHGGRGSKSTAADVIVSFERPSMESMLVSRLATLATGLFASEEWVDRNGRPASGRNLSGASMLVGDPDDPRMGLVLGGTAEGVAENRMAVRTTNREAAFAAVREGLGVGLLPVVLAEREPGLARLLPDAGSTLDVWMSMHPDLKHAAQVRVAVDALRRALRSPSG